MEPLLSRLQLRHIRLIHAIAECGQISIAATRLSLTQPAASRTLAEIERLVGEALFERHPKGMIPTPIGEVMVRHAGTLMGDLDATAADMDAFRHGQSGVVRIGAVTGPAVSYVVPAVQRLKQDARLAEVSLDVAPSVELMAGLLRGDYDLVLCRVPPDMDPRLLEIMRGRVEEIGFLTRAGHPLLRRRGLTFAQLTDMSWVIQSTGMPIRAAVEQAFINRDLPVPRDTINTASLLVALSYLRNTEAVAAISREVIDLLIDGGAEGWATLDMSETVILSPYHVIRLKGRPMTPVAARLLDLVQAEMAG
jgi:DNA-binding transcriptional LysR family regulator